MTTTQLNDTRPDVAKVIGDTLDQRDLAGIPDSGEEDADELRLLALEIIMYDPELAKQLVRAGVRKVMSESPTASG